MLWNKKLTFFYSFAFITLYLNGMKQPYTHSPKAVLPLSFLSLKAAIDHHKLPVLEKITVSDINERTLFQLKDTIKGALDLIPKYLPTILLNNNGRLNFPYQQLFKENSSRQFSLTEVPIRIFISNDHQVITRERFNDAPASNIGCYIEVWKAINRDYKLIRTLQHSENAILLTHALSNDGNYVASVDYSGIINLWETKTGSLIQTLADTQGRGRVLALNFSHDGSILAAGAQNCIVYIWQKQKTQHGTQWVLAKRVPATKPPCNLAFSPDDTLLILSNAEIFEKTENPKTPWVPWAGRANVQEPSIDIVNTALSLDKKLLALSCIKDKAIFIIEILMYDDGLSQWKTIKPMNTKCAALDLQFSLLPDKRQIFSFSAGTSAFVFDASSWLPLAHFRAPRNTICTPVPNTDQFLFGAGVHSITIPDIYYLLCALALHDIKQDPCATKNLETLYQSIRAHCCSYQSPLITQNQNASNTSIIPLQNEMPHQLDQELLLKNIFSRLDKKIGKCLRNCLQENALKYPLITNFLLGLSLGSTYGFFLIPKIISIIENLLETNAGESPVQQIMAGSTMAIGAAPLLVAIAYYSKAKLSNYLRVYLDDSRQKRVALMSSMLLGMIMGSIYHFS